MENEHDQEVLTGAEAFPGNQRLAELFDKSKVSELSPTEQEELDLGSEFYAEERAGGKPWQSNPEAYQRWQDLKKENGAE